MCIDLSSRLRSKVNFCPEHRHFVDLPHWVSMIHAFCHCLLRRLHNSLFACYVSLKQEIKFAHWWRRGHVYLECGKGYVLLADDIPLKTYDDYLLGPSELPFFKFTYTDKSKKISLYKSHASFGWILPCFLHPTMPELHQFHNMIAFLFVFSN